MPDRPTPFKLTDERDMLVDFLDYVREGVIEKVADLGVEDAIRPSVPSGTSLLGLVKHLAWVEEFWFTYAYQGIDDPLPAEELESGDDVETVIGAYRAACERSNAVVRGEHDLDVRCAGKGVAPEPMSLRWVLVHLVEETARHAGHADIIREQLDGESGR